MEKADLLDEYFLCITGFLISFLHVHLKMAKNFRQQRRRHYTCNCVYVFKSEKTAKSLLVDISRVTSLKIQKSVK